MKTTDASTKTPRAKRHRTIPVWSRIGLIPRLAITIGIAAFAGTGLYTALSLQDDIEYSRVRQERLSAQIHSSLSSQIAEYAILGDYSTIEQRLDETAIHQPDIAFLRWKDRGGREIEATADVPKGMVPEWFRNLAGISQYEQSRPVALAGQNYGDLTVCVLPDNTVNQLWERFLGQAGIALLLAGSLTGLVTLILRQNLRTLSHIAVAADHFQRGESEVRVEPRGDPQSVATARAFNDMADRIGDLIQTLSSSEEEIREQLHFSRELIEAIPNPVFYKNRDGHYIGVNKAWEEFFLVSRDEIIGRSDHWLYEHDPGTAEHHNAMDEILWQRPGRHSYEIEIHRRDHSERHTLYSKTTLTHADGVVYGLLGTIVDITDRKLTEEALFQQKERAQVTLASIGDGVITTDSTGAIEYMNPAAEAICGVPRRNTRGQSLESVLPLTEVGTAGPIPSLALSCMRDQAVVSPTGDIRFENTRGERFALEISAAPIRDRSSAVTGAVIVFRDITRSRAMAQQISWQASHDSLTGLVNRHAFESLLDRAIASARDLDLHHCLLYLDLDQFKVVNDTCGHTAGDELLKQLGPLLQGHIRGGDTLARLGGDEFGVLLERCPLPKAMQLAKDLLAAVKSYRFAWEQQFFTIGVSIGVVGISKTSFRLEDVLGRADIACYAAKEAGRNRFHVYQEDDAVLTQRHSEMRWVSRINDALEKKNFVLHFQSIAPVVNTTSEGLHFEILVRMREGEHVIAPGQFMPAAERFNLMPAIDQHILASTFAWLKSSPSFLAELHTCSINLSGHSLSEPTFAEHIAQMVDESGIPPEKICFEITETAAIANLSRTRELIARLKGLGCRFSLDDFGSGFSSFAYLKTLPVDYLKIDGTFIRHLPDDPIDAAMVQAINQVGHVLGIKTIAEFVESDAIRAKLRAIGVDYAQGYAIAPPRPVEDLKVTVEGSANTPRLVSRT